MLDAAVARRLLGTPPSVLEVARDQARVREGGLYEFGKLAFPHVEGRPLIESRHLRVLCRHLEQVSRGEILRLLINVPPGTGKSSWLCVLWPAWDWVERPWRRWMFASFDDGLVLRDARKTRALIESDWYQERWGPDAMIEGGCQIDRTRSSADKAGEYWTTAGGLRFSTTIGSKGTGWHSHIQVIDDPHKALDASGKSDAPFEEVARWYDETMSSRRIVGEPFARVVDMQRLSERDLSEHCIRKGTYHHLCFPMLYRADHPYLDEDDWRKTEGELLCPGLKDAAAVEEEAVELGPIGRAAQHDQLPSPRGGAVFRRDWCTHYWTEIPEGAEFLQSWDFTFGATGESASWVVGQIWARYRSKRYLVDQVRDRVEYPAMEAMLKSLSAKHPRAAVKLVEDKAAGKPIVQANRDDVEGLLERKVHGGTGGKRARAIATTGLWEAGSVWLPHPSHARLYGERHSCPWIHDFVERLCSFKGLDSDVADEVDAMSQAMAYMTEHDPASYLESFRSIE